MLCEQLSESDRKEKDLEKRVLDKNAMMAKDQQRQLEEFKAR